MCNDAGLVYSQQMKMVDTVHSPITAETQSARLKLLDT